MIFFRNGKEGAQLFFHSCRNKYALRGDETIPHDNGPELISLAAYIDMYNRVITVSFSSNVSLDGTCSVLTLPFQCTDFTVQRIVGRKSMSAAS